MKAVIVGGDLRFAYLARMLTHRGVEARSLAMERAEVPGLDCARMEDVAQADALVLNAPLQIKYAERQVTLEEVLQGARDGAKLIFAGPSEAPGTLPARFDIYDLSRDEAFLCKNAHLTAEGAIAAAMNACPDGIADCHCLVIGWGRIGRALTELLMGLGSEVTVATRSESGLRQARACGAHAVHTERVESALPGKQIVFSTPPALVLDATRLQKADADACIIDLASPPYGVDLQAARDMGLNAWREGGVPGRFCPRSAARVLADCVMKTLESQGGE